MEIHLESSLSSGFLKIRGGKNTIRFQSKPTNVLIIFQEFVKRVLYCKRIHLHINNNRLASCPRTCRQRWKALKPDWHNDHTGRQFPVRPSFTSFSPSIPSSPSLLISSPVTTPPPPMQPPLITETMLNLHWSWPTLRRH